MSEKSIFSRIIDRELPADILFENESIIVIRNIAPHAPIHLLGITKQPYQSIHSLLQDPNGKDLLWQLMQCLSNLAIELGIAESGYKLTTNVGVDGGQSVSHLHVHLLGGMQLQE